MNGSKGDDHVLGTGREDPNEAGNGSSGDEEHDEIMRRSKAFADIEWPVELEEGFGETFFVPLLEDQLANIGKISTLFGAIEKEIEHGIMNFAGLDNWLVAEILLEKTMFGTKVDMLKKLAKLKSDLPSSVAVLNACQSISAIISDRNDVIHGRWGLLMPQIQALPGGRITEESTIGIKVAASTNKRPNNPFLAANLNQLIARVEAACRELHEALHGSGKTAYPVTSLFQVRKRNK